MEKLEDGLYMHEGRLLLLGREKEYSQLYAAKLIHPADREEGARCEDAWMNLDYITMDIDQEDLPEEALYWQTNFPMDGDFLNPRVDLTRLEVEGIYFGREELRLFGDFRKKFLKELSHAYGYPVEDDDVEEEYFSGDLNIEFTPPTESRQVGPRTIIHYQYGELIARETFPSGYDMVDDSRHYDALKVWRELSGNDLSKIPELRDTCYSELFLQNTVLYSKAGVEILRRMVLGDHNPGLN